MKIKNQSQAALNFLMSYGWIIALFLVVITSLDYFWVIGLTAIFPEKCALPYRISCVDFKVKSSEIIIFLQNGIKIL